MKVWLPALRSGSGSDVYTQRLEAALRRAGVDARIAWFPHWMELAPWFARRPRGERVDVVHANAVNAFAFREPGVPLVATALHNVHDEATAGHRSLAQKAYHRLMLRNFEERSYAAATITTAISRATADSITRTFGLKDVATIMPWVDTNLFCPLPAARPAPASPFRLLFVGNWTRRKGADLLLPILQRLGDGFELRILAGLRGAPADVQLPPNARLLGRAADEKAMADLYRDCDALLFPSRLEGFGYAPAEAHACGVPVVATDVSSIPEVVIDGQTGILCPTDDVESFAAACRRLAEDRKVAQAMGAAGREHALAAFSEARCVRDHVAIYERAARLVQG